MRVAGGCLLLGALTAAPRLGKRSPCTHHDPGSSGWSSWSRGRWRWRWRWGSATTAAPAATLFTLLVPAPLPWDLLHQRGSGVDDRDAAMSSPATREGAQAGQGLEQGGGGEVPTVHLVCVHRQGVGLLPHKRIRLLKWQVASGEEEAAEEEEEEEEAEEEEEGGGEGGGSKLQAGGSRREEREARIAEKGPL